MYYKNLFLVNIDLSILLIKTRLTIIQRKLFNIYCHPNTLLNIINYEDHHAFFFQKLIWSMTVNLPSSDYKFYVTHSDLEKCQNLKKPMSNYNTSVFINYWNITELTCKRQFSQENSDSSTIECHCPSTMVSSLLFHNCIIVSL